MIFRPISPHLQIYKPQLTSILSIFHRMSGILLTMALFFILFLIKYATTFSVFLPMPLMANILNSFDSFLLFALLLFCVLLLSFHAQNGIRHLIWDSAKGLKLSILTKSAILVLFNVILIFITFYFYFIT